MARQIKLETLPDKVRSEDVPGYRELLEVCINKVPTQGITMAQMRKLDRLFDVLEPLSNGDTAVFEDADWEVLKVVVNAYGWPARHKSFIEFVDAVEQAEKVPVKASE
jgi:hypothetical protein